MGAPGGSGEQAETGTGNMSVVPQTASGRDGIRITKDCLVLKQLSPSLEKCLSSLFTAFVFQDNQTIFCI